MEEAELAGWYSPARDRDYFMGKIGEQKLHWFAHLTEEILVMRQLTPAPVPVVLDFGCNWGKWASMALAHGCEVYAVEVNRDAAAFCASRGIKMVTLADLKSLRFDFINVDQVMEHLSDPLGIARELAASLKPGGRMKWSTPHHPHLPKLLRAAQASGSDAVLERATLDPLEPIEHVNLFTGAALEVLGRQVGLKPMKLPLGKWLGAGQLWNIPRQLNRNLTTPLKRWSGRGAYRWFQKAS
jgi:2-polyprenyl-3-methyl-5-hydroxy-6-metoxy-1,4-benzoquinol methylase